MDHRTGIRVNLTIPPDLMATIDRICTHAGMGRATFIVQSLIDAHSSLEQVAKAMEIAKQQEAQALDMARNVVKDAQSDLKQLDLQVSGIKRRSPRRKRPQ